jgi:molybdenum cofactor biosynthesis protein B
MSVEGHKHEAGQASVSITVVVVTSTRTDKTDTSGKALAAKLGGAGHKVSGPAFVDDDVDAIRTAIQQASTQAVVLTGGTGMSSRDVTPEALRGLVTRRIPGFGELFRALSYQEIGSAAMLSRATAGLVGDKVVFALPGSTAAVNLALDKLILPELAHLLQQVTKEGAQAVAVEPDEEEEEVIDADFEEVDDETPQLPPPSGAFGALGQTALALGLSDQVPTSSGTSSGSMSEAAGDDGIGARGWKRAIYELKGEVIREKREQLPDNIEKLAPVLDVLHTAGEQAVLKLEDGRKFSVWGWPDLRRPGAKVLAIGWGEPLAEILALHRYPVTTGTCIEEAWGQCPGAYSGVEAACLAVTGSAPADTDGELFAVQGDAVWFLRGSSVIRWDGRKEHNDGNIKQVLATLVLHWSNR